MRSLLDFYRENPVLAVILILVGVGVAVGTQVFSDGGVILPIAFAALVGVLVGIIVAGFQRRR